MQRKWVIASWGLAWTILAGLMGASLDPYLNHLFTLEPLLIERSSSFGFYFFFYGMPSVAGGTVALVWLLGTLAILILGWRRILPGVRWRDTDCPHCSYECDRVPTDTGGIKTCPECGGRLVG